MREKIREDGKKRERDGFGYASSTKKLSLLRGRETTRTLIEVSRLGEFLLPLLCVFSPFVSYILKLPRKTVRERTVLFSRNDVQQHRSLRLWTECDQSITTSMISHHPRLHSMQSYTHIHTHSIYIRPPWPILYARRTKRHARVQVHTHTSHMVLQGGCSLVLLFSLGPINTHTDIHTHTHVHTLIKPNAYRIRMDRSVARGRRDASYRRKRDTM